jgi:hypothetical protein
MSGNATRKLTEATDAFMHDLEGARETMMRIAQIQAKMSQTMDECLAEFRALFPAPEPQQLQAADHYDNPGPLNQEELPRMMQPANSKRYDQ